MGLSERDYMRAGQQVPRPGRGGKLSLWARVKFWFWRQLRVRKST
jgi:hypothetical protein